LLDPLCVYRIQALADLTMEPGSAAWRLPVIKNLPV
jgi:hypothetical protein